MLHSFNLCCHSFNSCCHSQHVISLIHDLHLDTAITQVSTCMQRVQRLLERKCMAHKWLEIQNFTSKTLETCGPRVAITVDELQVDLRG
jgi:hypothetical protein